MTFTGISAPKMTADKASVFGGRVRLLAIVVVIISLTMPFAALHYFKNLQHDRALARFDASVERAVAILQTRMSRYEDALWAGVAAVNAQQGSMSLAEWQVFARSLNLPEKYPGISGIGVIDFLSGDQKAAYLSDQRAERPEFSVFPAHDFDTLMPITYIEPVGPNREAVGLDVAHEVNRRDAALAARRTGRARITGPIILVQDAGSTPGFLFYAPFYQAPAPQSDADRVARARGAVYAPFVVRELMAGLLSRDLRTERFSITDEGQTIYDEHGVDDPTQDPDPMFTTTRTVDLYGRQWQLDLRSNLQFRAEDVDGQPTVIFLGGVVIVSLILFLLFQTSRANLRAVRYAAEVTEALRREKTTLARTNHELEQFAYVTSHDLKTPIRGIGGLTSLLQEDLQPYTSEKDANPDIARNLDRIQERVRRMDELTSGVLALSQIGSSQETEASLDLERALAALRSDWGLGTGQLVLEGAVSHLAQDAFNLRRVLENLISNAVVHHPKRSDLRIKVQTRAVGDRCIFSVKDNGPGIDPRYHDRIFNFFETLPSEGWPETTGVGLAIVKKAVMLHGGSIDLVSDVGHGATFTFDWPYDENEAGLEPDSAAV